MMNLERCRVPYSFQGPHGFGETRIPEFDISGNTVKDDDNGDQQGSLKILITFYPSSTIFLKRICLSIRAVAPIVSDLFLGICYHAIKTSHIYESEN